MADARIDLFADLADPVRLGALEHLERGAATASELATQLGVSPTQLANHLRRLRDHGLVTTRRSGRHTYYEFAEPGLRELFSIVNGLRPRPDREQRPRQAASTCYDHLAGRLGVELYDALVKAGALMAREGEGELELGPDAARVLERFGARIPMPGRRLLAYACLDSGEGRPHLGGALGAELANALDQRGWIVRGAGSRYADVTTTGRRSLKRLGVSV
jgi:DNA-binding transcriptional ArsR family regulator